MTELVDESTAAGGLHIAAVIERGEFRLDVAFAVAPGEVLGVLGPNGAGKTTLLRALAGLTSLSSGQIRLGQRCLDDSADIFLPANERPIGLVFQNYRLFPHLSVRDNVAFAARSQGVRKRTARAAADRWLDRLGLAEFSDRRPARLSGGQAQRVALARALAALDARTRLEVRAELRRHLAAFTGPTLMVTHDPLDAMVMTDRLLVIEDGQIVQQGTPAEVARRPVTQYVAKLMGLNLYSGRRAGREVHLAEGGMFVVVGDRPPADVLVAVRPSAISVHTQRPEASSPRNVWPGHVDGLELLGDRVRMQVSGQPPALVDLTPDAVANLELEYGSPVWLSVKATDIDVYPDQRP
jgi:molybdate transport system ATP-binding protein